MNKEKWKTIIEFPDYDVSDQGRVRSWKKPGPGKNKRKIPKILHLNLTRDGYFKAQLCKDKEVKSRTIHRLVLETFIGSCPKEMQACHNNGIGTNNRLTNLRWDTPKNNHADKIKHGTISRGTQIKTCRLTEKQVLKIRKDPRILRIIAMDYGVVKQTIFYIKTRKNWAWLKS